MVAARARCDQHICAVRRQACTVVHAHRRTTLCLNAIAPILAVVTGLVCPSSPKEGETNRNAALNLGDHPNRCWPRSSFWDDQKAQALSDAGPVLGPAARWTRATATRGDHSAHAPSHLPALETPKRMLCASSIRRLSAMLRRGPWSACNTSGPAAGAHRHWAADPKPNVPTEVWWACPIGTGYM